MAVLSIEECRRILGELPLSDAEIAEVRDTLYAFAHTLIDGHLRAAGRPPSKHADERSPKP